MRQLLTFGSVCSGIEAASYILEPLGLKPLWLSEIAKFPSMFLKEKYPNVPNLGDMNDIPQLIKDGKIEVPDMLCGGTPCQAFSLAGWKAGLSDSRGQLTLKYIEILNEIDRKRKDHNMQSAIFLWENVEGVLSDKTNAFGYFLAGLAGLDEPIVVNKWTSSGVLKSKTRNIAWRVLDGKYFGIPQQRRRLYVIGGGTDFSPESILFELGDKITDPYKAIYAEDHAPNLFSGQNSIEYRPKLKKQIDNYSIEVFRMYSDCLYAAYGTKWNGNAAAYNGSLFVAQNNRLRRLSPIECERLMGLPDNYTNIVGSRDTTRYQAIGNSWAIPVVSWIMNRIIHGSNDVIAISNGSVNINSSTYLYLLNEFKSEGCKYINSAYFPYQFKISQLVDIIDTKPNDKLYISPTGCRGILRRTEEKNIKINQNLKNALLRSIDFTENITSQV